MAMAQPSLAALVGSLRAALLLVGLLAASAGRPSNDTFFCRFTCASNFTSGCHLGECPAPPEGCSLLAAQPFVDREVCSEFLQSEPACDGTTRQCAEAASFQLAHDRINDLERTYRLQDWFAVAHTFSHDGVVFSPGGTGFVMGRSEIAVAVEAVHTSSKMTGFVLKVAQVFTVQGQGAAGQTIHAAGTWAPEQASSLNQEGAKFYARWIEVAGARWVMDTFLMAPAASANLVGESLFGTSGATDARNKWSAADPTFAAIQARQSRFASLYNAGNYTGLVAEMYADGSAILPGAAGKLVPKASAEAYFKGMPLGSQANVYPTIVAQGPGGLVAHEVGFSGSTLFGYYARWSRASEGKEWVIESHCFGVFPKVDAGLQLVV